MDHVLAFRAWPAAPNAGVIFPISSVLGCCNRFPAGAPVMGIFCPGDGRKPPENAWKKGVVNLYLVFETDSGH
jgi:hypothetical protein